MSRRSSRNRGFDPTEAVLRAGVFVIVLLSLGIGGMAGWVPVFGTLLEIGIGVFLIFGLIVVGLAIYRKRRAAHESRRVGSIVRPTDTPNSEAPAVFRSRPVEQGNPSTLAPAWDERRILEALGRIDWYQFEKLSTALLSAEGWNVQRRGGAHPDGGKDIVARRDGQTILVQCKHWRTWKVQEKVIRELLGSMSVAGVASGAIHTLHGFTKDAEELAACSGVSLHDGPTLASRAQAHLTDDDLTRLLADKPHLCPKCDSRMILRTGSFNPFWGCARYPRCRGKIECSSMQAAEL
jgi:HJR/Mrr/RecB family endonuclease